MSYIDALSTLKFKTIKCEVEGLTFYLREISLATRMKYDSEKDTNLKILKMMFASLCDEKGILTEKEADFDRFLEVTPERVLRELITSFTTLNYPSEKEDKELKNA